jgi:SWI/SNF-related matrix-associated actin-dependent regulator 1 of chromatin subfamily A
MEIKFDNGIFVAHCKFEDREKLRTAGFHWNLQIKKWTTKEARIAARLDEYLSPSARSEVQKIQNKKYPVPEILPVPSKKLKPYSYQIEAAKHSLALKNSYIELDPGLGKTICAALVMNALANRTALNVVYICPPFLVSQVRAELMKWTIEDVDFYVWADSMLTKPELVKQALEYSRMREQNLLVYDEAHRIKEPTAARSKALYQKIAPHFKRVLLLSGTAMPNKRPIEIFPVLSHFAPEVIDYKNRFEYGLKYCAAFEGKWGWDFSGASNVDELKEKLKAFIFTRRKSEVEHELPEKSLEIVVIGETLSPKIAKLDRELLKLHSPRDLLKKKIAGDEGEIHIATYRREVGLSKVKASLDFITSEIENSEESFIIFCVHKDVVSSIFDGLKDFSPEVITGETPMDKRQKIAKKFQEKETRILIANIQAAGIGFNLTACTRIIFVEYSYVPGDNEQAIDRAHRLGQKQKVRAQFLVFKDSLDRAILDSMLEKKERNL